MRPSTILVYKRCVNIAFQCSGFFVIFGSFALALFCCFSGILPRDERWRRTLGTEARKVELRVKTTDKRTKRVKRGRDGWRVSFRGCARTKSTILVMPGGVLPSSQSSETAQFTNMGKVSQRSAISGINNGFL